MGKGLGAKHPRPERMGRRLKGRALFLRGVGRGRRGVRGEVDRAQKRSSR